jgi:enoyl-CoA hydratase
MIQSTSLRLVSRATRTTTFRAGTFAFPSRGPSSSRASGLFSTSALKDSYENILVTLPADGVGLITLNRPKALNALSDALFEDLLHATSAFDNDPSIGCLILTGSKKAFAAGADISEMQSKEFEDVYGGDMFAQWQELSKLNKPTIAAVSGYCLGGGCELAMMCDIMVS